MSKGAARWVLRRPWAAAKTRRHNERKGAPPMMGDIGEEITEIELEPLPAEMPAEEPVQPAMEPVPG